MELKLKIDSPLGTAAHDALMGRLMYSLGPIENCYFDPDTSSVVVEVSKENASAVESIFQRILDEIRQTRYLRKSTIEKDLTCDCHLAGEAREKDTFPDRIFESVFNAVRHALDKICTPFADQYLRFPSMISTETMMRCDYLRTFPQNAYVVEQFPHDYGALDKIKTEPDLRNLQVPSGKILSPATCFHYYDRNADKKVENSTATLALSRCFRHEASWRKGAHRLKEFDMLELIFVGPEDYVEKTRQSVMDQIWAFSRRLGLPGLIESAQDPFYLPEDSSKAQFQMMSTTKYELVFESAAAGTGFSIASFNNVFESLCKQFNITNSEGQFHNSGCVAFGLDRWVVALLLLYGEKVEDWPAETRLALGLEGESQ